MIPKATSEERIKWRLLDLEKTLNIGFARVHLQFEEINKIFDRIEKVNKQKNHMETKQFFVY